PGLLKKARVVAARRGLSVSALLAGELRELVAEDRAYESACVRAKDILRTGFSLQGARMEDRDATHERRRLR
ncbi:MAG: hypothetical protein ACRD1G_06495, partial [Acidimicrobiales bacterium]